VNAANDGDRDVRTLLSFALTLGGSTRKGSDYIRPIQYTSAFTRELTADATRQFSCDGVDIRVDTRVTAVEPDAVVFSDGHSAGDGHLGEVDIAEEAD
jgi:hypothetical protein